MKLRDSLKTIAIAMVAESIILALKQTFINNFDTIQSVTGQLADIIRLYYAYVANWLQLLLYVLFAIHIVLIGSRIPNNRFTFYFVLDALVAIFNAVIVFFSYESALLAFFLKFASEACAIVTTIVAGWTLYRDLNIKPVRTICLSYWVLSLRHLLYCLILLVTLSTYGINGLSTQAMQDKTIISITWWLIVPTLILSRIMLYYGTKGLKANADQEEKEQTLTEI